MTEVVISGVGETKVGRLPGRSSLSLHAEAAKLALADAGLPKSAIDGVITDDTFTDSHPRQAMQFAEYFGIASTAKHIQTVAMGSAGSGGLLLHHAAMLIRTGLCHAVLLVTADNLLSSAGRTATGTAAIARLAVNRHRTYEVCFGPTVPAIFGMVAHRYTAQYGTTRQQMAHYAVTMRQNAARHPLAHFTKPITVDDVLNSPPVATPLHLLDCAPVSDGGCALVITAGPVENGHPPVYVRGWATSFGDHHGRVTDSFSQVASLTEFGMAQGADQAMHQAGVSRRDIDLLMLYDPFTIWPIVTLEELGFCQRGEGGEFIAAGQIAIDGELPVNPHGGLLSFGHPVAPGGLFMFTEATHQLRGEGGPRQVAGAEVALVQGYGAQLGIFPATVLTR